MSRKQKRNFDHIKDQTVEALLSKRKTLEQLSTELDVNRNLILKWRNAYLANRALNGASNPPVSHQPVAKPSISPVSMDSRDKEIFRLKIIIANLMMERDKLQAELHNNRRYSDQQLYGLDPIDQDLLK